MARSKRATPDSFLQHSPPGYATLADHPEVSMVTGVDPWQKGFTPVPMGKTPVSGWTTEWAAQARNTEVRNRGGIKS